MMDELKSCPFCGSEAEIRHWENDPNDDLAVCCTGCSVDVGWYGDASEAVRIWNRRAGEAAPPPAAFDLLTHLSRQIEWSRRTFGPGDRAKGVVDHIRKELREIENAPHDLEEWVDVVILGLDGAWRSGATPAQIVAQLQAKQAKNEARNWPDWRTMPADRAIEHDRSQEPPPQPVIGNPIVGGCGCTEDIDADSRTITVHPCPEHEPAPVAPEQPGPTGPIAQPDETSGLQPEACEWRRAEPGYWVAGCGRWSWDDIADVDACRCGRKVEVRNVDR